MRRKPDPYRRDARRPYHIPLKGWRQVAERVWSESSRDNLSVIAAGCAFYALFAIFPGLSALISLYGLTADPTTIEQQVGGFRLGATGRGLWLARSGDRAPVLVLSFFFHRAAWHRDQRRTRVPDGATHKERCA